MREFSGVLLLAVALTVLAWGLWRLYGPRRRVHGIKVKLPDDEG